MLREPTDHELRIFANRESERRRRGRGPTDNENARRRGPGRDVRRPRADPHDKFRRWRERFFSATTPWARGRSYVRIPPMHARLVLAAIAAGALLLIGSCSAQPTATNDDDNDNGGTGTGGAA